MIVDIHNHLLPGLDDGPKKMEEAILLARDAADIGVTHIIATPHRNSQYAVDRAAILEAVDHLNKQLVHYNIPVAVFPGEEVNLYNCLELDRAGEDLLPLMGSGKYVLVELPDDHFPSFTFEVLFRLQLRGQIPIISHPERNVMCRRKKQLVYELVTKGALLQVTASGLLGKHGRAQKKFAMELIRHNLVHFIASDAHHPTARPFLLNKAYQFVRKKFSLETENYLRENAKHVFSNTDFHPLSPFGFE